MFNADDGDRWRQAREELRARCCGDLDASGTCFAPACRQGEALKAMDEMWDHIEDLERRLKSVRPESAPIDMLLFCPRCGMQHVDAPNEAQGWTNPPHATHTCQGCGLLWRPSNVNTNGVLHIAVIEEKHRDRILASWPSSHRSASAALTDRELTALEGLIQVASATYNALDDSEERGEEVILTQDHSLKIGEALEALNGLPDDQPNVVMCPSAKAAWSLDRLLNPSVAVSASGALIGTVSVGQTWVTDRVGPFSALPEGEYELRRVDGGAKKA